MMDSPHNAFANYLTCACRDLLQQVAETTGVPLAVLDPHGEVLLATSDARRVPTPGRDAQGEPLEASIATEVVILGRLVALADHPDLGPLLNALAREISGRFDLERDLDHMTERLAQSYDEITLLYRFARLLQPDESFADNAHKILEETADLLEHRLLVLVNPERDYRVWSAGPSLTIPDSLTWLVHNPRALDQIYTAWLPELDPEQNRYRGQSSTPQGPVHYVISPVRTREDVTGYVGVFCSPADAMFETSELRLVECLAEQLSHTATARRLHQELREMLFNTVRSLVAAIDAKDEYTRGHSERVYEVSLRLAERLGCDAEQLQKLSWAALLHDIGKIAIGRKILNKPARLTDEEFKIIQSHPERGCRVLEPIPQLRSTLTIIRHHHERYDGRGYPDGLRGEQIPLLARIIAVADTYDAIVSTRAYRQARSPSFALEEVRRGAGTQFDPRVAEVFLELAEEGALEPAEPDLPEGRAA